MNNAKVILGKVLNYFMAAMLIVSGCLKLIKFEPYMDVIKTLNPHYYDHIYLIGLVALTSGLLFIYKKTFTIGAMCALVFLGGTISAHMQAGDLFIPQIVFAILVGLTVYLKRPQWF